MKEVGQQAEPVRVQPGLECLVGQNGRGPFDGVDLGHQRSVDEPRDIEQAVVCPFGVRVVQHVADGVVFPREKGVQHAEANPPVAHESGVLDARLGVDRQRAVGIQLHLPRVFATEAVLSVLVTAVELRAVPPVGDFVEESRLGRFFAHARRAAARRVDLRPADHQLGLLVAVLRGVVFGQGHLEEGAGLGIAVAYPVMVHELDPRRGQQIEEGDFLHLWLAHRYRPVASGV